MDAAFAKNIKEQLFLSGSVIVPNMGKLYTVKKMALLDSVRGQIEPPQADIFLDTDTKINDGILVDAVAHSESMSGLDAQKFVDAQTLSMRASLEKFELVTLDGFGRFYNDGMGKIHFLQDVINVNAESFALPTLSFEPISRTEKVSTNSAITTTLNDSLKSQPITTPLTATPFQYQNDYNMEPEIPTVPTTWGIEKNKFNIILLIAAVGCTLLAVLFVQIRKINEAKLRADAANISVDTVSTTANSAYLGADTLVHATIGSSIVAESKSKEKIVEKPAKVVEKVENSTKDKMATIVIGAFGNEKNIAKLESWISNKGYQLYTEKRGNLTVVGAKVGYNTKDDLKKLVSSFKSKYGKDVFVQ